LLNNENNIQKNKHNKRQVGDKKEAILSYALASKLACVNSFADERKKERLCLTECAKRSGPKKPDRPGTFQRSIAWVLFFESRGKKSKAKRNRFYARF